MKRIKLVSLFLLLIFGILNQFDISLISDFDSTVSSGEYKLIEVDGGNLSGERQSNVKVDIGFGDREYFSYTNEFGQVNRVTAHTLTLQNEDFESVNSDGRYYHDEAKVDGTESSYYDEGHIIM